MKDDAREILECIFDNSKKAKRRARDYGVSDKYITAEQFDNFDKKGSYF